MKPLGKIRVRYSPDDVYAATWGVPGNLVDVTTILQDMWAAVLGNQNPTLTFDPDNPPSGFPSIAGSCVLTLNWHHYHSGIVDVWVGTAQQGQSPAQTLVLPPTVPPVPAPIPIVFASYGEQTNCNLVTDIVSSMYLCGVRNFYANSEIWGHPAPGVRKWLTIYYQDGQDWKFQMVQQGLDGEQGDVITLP